MAGNPTDFSKQGQINTLTNTDVFCHVKAHPRECGELQKLQRRVGGEL